MMGGEGDRSRLLISDECVDLIESIPQLLCDPKKPEDVLKTSMDSDDWADCCLVAGTLIETASGLVPIEAIKTGDFVLTRAGYKLVISAGLTTQDAAILELRTSDGKILRGTANHPVLTLSGEFIPLGELTPGVELWPRPSQSYSTGSPFAGTQMQDNGHIGSIIRRAAAIENAASASCTRRSGNPRMVRYPRAATSTISTRIPTIMQSKTSNALPSGSIKRNIHRQMNKSRRIGGILTLSGKRRLNGTAAQRGASGTAFTVKRHGRSESPSKSNANIAAVTTRLRSEAGVLASAQTTAKHDLDTTLGSISSALSVLSAELNSSARNTRKLRHVPPPVVESLKASTTRENVYNLEVAEQPEYFANGLLVHNCRMLLKSHLSPRGKPIDTLKAEALAPHFERGDITAVHLASLYFDQKHKKDTQSFVPKRRRR